MTKMAKAALAALTLTVVLVVYLIRVDTRMDSSVDAAGTQTAKTTRVQSEPALREQSDDTARERLPNSDHGASSSPVANAGNETPPIGEHGPIIVRSADGTVADEEETLAWIRKYLGTQVAKKYDLLVSDLDLSPEDKEALVDLLIEFEAANTKTNYNTGDAISEEERNLRIAEVIGQQGLTDFLNLESRRDAYAEAQKFSSLFEVNEQPLSVDQRRSLVDIVEEARNVVEQELASNTELSSADPAALHRFKWSEYQRHLMELAPSVLEDRQVVLLDEQLSFLRYQIDSAIEQYEQKLANGADPKETRLTLPADFVLW